MSIEMDRVIAPLAILAALMIVEMFGVNQFGPLATIRMAVENGKF